MSRRTEIIEKSALIIGMNGIQSFTTKKLAKEIGISEAALYRHFESKEEILFSVFDHFDVLIGKKISTLVESDLPVKDKIFGLFELHKEIFRAHPELVFLLFSEGSFIGIEELSPKITQMLHQKFELIENLILEGQANGEVRLQIDAHELSKMLMGYFRMYLLQLRLEENMDNLDRYCNNFFETIKKLL